MNAPLTLGLSDFLARHADKIQRDGDCLVWTAARDPRGYGRVGVVENGHKRVRFPHRLAYALAHGPIPPRTDIDHTCHNPPCLNPDHLRAASHQQNLRNRKGADRNSRTGIRGVRYRADCNNPWEARVFVDGREVIVGRFASMEDAGEAASEARERYYGEFAGGA